jgi:hypothetical protein
MARRIQQQLALLLLLGIGSIGIIAAQQQTTYVDSEGNDWVVEDKQFEETTVSFDVDGTTYTYPGRTGEAGAFPVNGKHAHTEFCNDNGFRPQYAEGSQLPVGSAAVKNWEVGTPWSDVRGESFVCSTESERATPRELSNALHGQTQQAHGTVNHVTSASLQTMAHDVGTGNTLDIQFAYGPLMVLSSPDVTREIIFFGGAAFTTLPGYTVEETLQELYVQIRSKFDPEYFRTPISSSDDIFNTFQVALGEPLPDNENGTHIQSFVDFAMSAIAIEPLLSCNHNATELTAEGSGETQEVYEVDDFDNLCDVRRHVNDVSPAIDASFVYGSDLKTADALRERNGSSGELSCKMRVRANGDGTTSLPTISDLEEEDKAFFRQITDTFHRCRFADFGEESTREGCTDQDLAVAGDRRSNENNYLHGIHNVLLRKHNQWCDLFANDTAHFAHGWSEEQKYHEARVRTMAVYQHAFVLSSIDFAGLVSLGQDRPSSGYEGAEGIQGREVYEVFVPDMEEWNANGKLISEVHDECDEAVACGVSIENWLDRFQQWPECQDTMTNLLLRWHPALYDEMAVIEGPSWGFGEEGHESCLSEHDGLEEEEGEEEEGEGPPMIDIEEGINTIIAQPQMSQMMGLSGNLANVLRSAISTHANGNVGFPQSMRNMLFGRNAVIDLAALNIARFRERGVVTVWDALSYLYPQQYPSNATDAQKQELKWEDLHLDPRVEPHFRSMFCYPWQAEAYSVAISQKQDGFVLSYEDPDFGIFPGDNEGMGLGSVAMARYLSGARNFFGFLERFWMMERLEGDYPEEVKEEAMAFYNKIAAEEGFEDSIRSLFVETVPEFKEETGHCLPNNVWHTPLSSDFMTADGLRSEECDCLTTRFRVLHDSSPCLNGTDHMFLEVLGIVAPETSGWGKTEIITTSVIGAYATLATILLGVVFFKKSQAERRSAARVASMEKPMITPKSSGSFT